MPGSTVVSEQATEPDERRAATATADRPPDRHASTRMRALANAPTPTWRPSISTVSVPSGDAAVITPLRPGCSGARLEVLEQPGRELQLLGDPAHDEVVADVDLGQRPARLLDVVRARDRVAVRARGRVAEQAVHRRLDVLAHHVLPLAGLVVRLRPRQLEHVGEEALGEAMPAHHPLGQLDALRA